MSNMSRDDGNPLNTTGAADDAGQPVPTSSSNARRLAPWRLQRAGLPRRTTADGVPHYRFAPDLPQPEVAGSATAGTNFLENDQIRVEVDPASGNIVSCIDKSTGIELVGAGGWNAAQVVEDRSDTWSHGIPGYGSDPLGHFGDANVRIAEEGPLQASLLIERAYEGSHWLQQLILRHGESRCAAQLARVAGRGSSWLRRRGPTRRRKLPFGWCCARRTGPNPTHMWMDVSGQAADSRRRPSAALSATEIRLRRATA